MTATGMSRPWIYLSIKIGKSRRITDEHLAAFIVSLEGDDAA
jgi:predicted DNA-binding transcriptional regulator AlpA